MKRLLALLPTLALALALGLPASAAAAATAAPAEPAQIQFALPADHGLHAHLETFNDKVTLEFERKGHNVTYETEGEPTAAGLKVRFGKLGRIDVAFEPTATQVERPPKGCTGPPSLRREGDFVGTISFAGEQGFVDVEASRVSGNLDIEREIEWKCPERGGPEFHPVAPRRSRALLERRSETELEPATLVARDPRCHCYFAAYARRDRHGRGPSFFVGGEFEEREAMEISRSTYVRAGASAFVFDHAAGTATVRPPGPFSGHATFKRRANRPALWRSTLQVALLGADPLSFPGLAAHARLVRAFPDDR